MRRRPRGSKADLKALVSFGGWIAISDLVFPMFTYVDRFLVGALAGVGRLPLYVIPHEIINRLWLVPTSLTAAVFPAASAIDRKADAERLAHLYAHGLRLMALATIPGAGVLALFAHDIIDVWISPEFADEAAPLLRIFALGLVINSSAMLASALIQGQGMPKLRAAIHLVEIPGYVVAAVVLVPKYGLVGAAWAWTIRMAITAVVIQFLLRSRLGLGRRILITHNVHVVAAPLVAFFVACLVLGPHMGFGPRVALAAAGAAVAGGTWRWVVHQDRHSADDSASVPTAK
jgi:O-antigen/teichoic acid export membrane protein